MLKDPRRQVIGLAICVVVAMGGFTLVVLAVSKQQAKTAARAAAHASEHAVRLAELHDERALSREQRAGCMGTARRATAELKIVWTVYTADSQTAASTASKPTTIAIRGTEAQSLLANMLAVARTRVDISAASQLPPVLAAAVRRENFHCAAAYPLRPGAKTASKVHGLTT